MTMTGTPAETWAATPGAAPAGASLAIGDVLARRYEILAGLGQGGMGAVYKAHDRELDRQVALKVIRPELASEPDVLRRFKQELILARQVTHRNVLRIFDLGVSGELKFITMEFVQGRDLSSIMAERRLAHDEAVSIVIQIAEALDAAHAEGVIHRDLKPHNVLINERGRVLVMDFGLARSLEAPALTQTGMLMGTPAYMSPEQAKGQPADARSDIFALGIIFYQLLTGKLPFQADTILASLLKRTQEPAAAPSAIDPTVPGELSNVVRKALAIDPGQRYQTAAEFVRDLRGQAAPASSPTADAPTLRVPVKRRLPSWIRLAVIGAVVLIAAIAGALFFGRRQGTGSAGPQKPVSVLVADFENRTGEHVFDGTLEPVLTLALEGAPFINVVRRDQALRAAAQIQAGAASIDEKLARLVAVRDGVQVVIAGGVEKRGSGYKLNVRGTDAMVGVPVVAREAEADSKDKVLAAITRLAAPVRAALGDATPESQQLAAAETFTAASLEAAHEYADAQNLRFGGRSDAAIQAYRRAIALDPKFGSAYASLAAMYANLGQREEATKLYKQAMAYLDRMTEREKYRTRGGYYLAVMDSQKAIEEFSALLQRYPADSMGRSALAFSYYLRQDMKRAIEEGRRALEIYPKNVPYRNNVALYSLYAGDFDGAARDAGTAMQQNPAYLKAYTTLALAELARGHGERAADVYGRMEKLGPRGASSSAMGLADLALYEGRVADATALLENSIASDLAGDNKAAAAKKEVMLASAHLLAGRKSPALAAIGRALELNREGVLFPAALALVDAGDYGRAAALAAELGRRVEPYPQAHARLIEGEIALARGRNNDALHELQASQQIADTWLGRLSMGRAYLAAGAWAEADSEFERCQNRRGEAVDVFLDEQQTFRFYPPLQYYIARVREGLRSPNAAEAYETFLALKSPQASEPLIQDARRRLATLKPGS